MISKEIKFIEFMLFGSGPKSFRRIGTHKRENKYYETFEENKFYPKLIEYPINRKDNKGFIKNLKIGVQFSNSILNPIFIGIFFSNFDLIRCKQIYGAWSGFILKKISRKKLIIRVGYSWSLSIKHESGSNSLKYKLSKIFEDILLRNADGLIVGSNYLFEKYNFINKNIVVVPNGIDNKFFKNFKKIRIYDYIFVGRLIKIKGVDRILNFIERHQDKRFLIIGSNPLKFNLEKYKNVTYISRLENSKLSTYMNKSKNIINFSRSEGSPKALIEGIACGCLPLVSNIKAHIDILKDLKYGTVLDFPSQKELSSTKYNPLMHKRFNKKYSLKNCVNKECIFMKKILNT